MKTDQLIKYTAIAFFLLFGIILFMVYRAGKRKADKDKNYAVDNGDGSVFEPKPIADKLAAAMDGVSLGSELNDLIIALNALPSSHVKAVWDYWEDNYKGEGGYLGGFGAWGSLRESIDSEVCSYDAILFNFDCNNRDDIFKRFEQLGV